MMQQEHWDFINEMSKKSRVLICGTGPSLGCLADAGLVAELEKHFNIFAINTAHHYFKNIDALVIGPHCGYSRDVRSSHLEGKNIKFYLSGDNLAHVQAKFIRVVVDIRGDMQAPALATDITMPLGHGPTTMLDVALPAALFCGMKRIFLLGAEYSTKGGCYKHFSADTGYRASGEARGFAGEMAKAQAKWKLWADHCAKIGVTIHNFSPYSELEFPKLDIHQERFS